MIPLYASVNDVLSLCMIVAVIALLVGRSQSFDSLHFVLRGNTSCASNSQKPSFPKSPLKIPLHRICKPFQVIFHVLAFKNLQNTSHFVTLFSAHGDVVVGFAIFHIVLFQKRKKREKKKRKKALLHGM
jgi:hypothetical protein